MDRFGHTQERLAEALGKSRSHIANLLRLLTLPEPVLELLRAGKLTAGHARALVTAAHPEALARQVVDARPFGAPDRAARPRRRRRPAGAARRRRAAGQGRRHPRARGGPDGQPAAEGQHRAPPGPAGRRAPHPLRDARGARRALPDAVARSSGCEQPLQHRVEDRPPGRRWRGAGSPRGSTNPRSRSSSIRRAAAARPASAAKRAGSTPSREPQAHHQHLDRLLLPARPAVARRLPDALPLDRLQPGLRRAQRLGRPASAAAGQPAVRARARCRHSRRSASRRGCAGSRRRAGRGSRSRRPAARPRRRSPASRGTCPRPRPRPAGRAAGRARRGRRSGCRPRWSAGRATGGRPPSPAPGRARACQSARVWPWRA